MAQSQALIDTLKRVLREQRITYARIADHLAISEASVKRMFSTGTFTLARLEAIAALARLELSDLIHCMEQRTQRITHLTEQQEKELVGDPKLLLAAICARNHCSYEDMKSRYRLTEAECIKALARLDRLRFIELLPGNRIKLLISPDFRWLPNGPVERFYARQVQQEYFQSRFTGEHETRLFLTGMLSRSSQEVLGRRLQALASEFAQLQREDLGLPVEERVNVGMMLAIRPWKLSVLRELERE